MFDVTGLSNIEVYEKLWDLIVNGKKITVQDLVDIVATRSVKDIYASDGALTVFYSGESEKFVNSFVKQAGEDIRVIRRTEAFDFLSNEHFERILDYAINNDNPGITDTDLEKEIGRLLYEQSCYEAGTKGRRRRILDSDFTTFCRGDDRRCLFTVYKRIREPYFCNG